jgi:hypothetical protein
LAVLRAKRKLLDAEMRRYFETAPRRAQSLRGSVGSSDGANADAMKMPAEPDFLNKDFWEDRFSILAVENPDLTVQHAVTQHGVT